MQIFRGFDMDLNKEEVDDTIAVFIGPFFSATTEGNLYFGRNGEWVL